MASRSAPQPIFFAFRGSNTQASVSKQSEQASRQAGRQAGRQANQQDASRLRNYQEGIITMNFYQFILQLQLLMKHGVQAFRSNADMHVTDKASAAA